MPTTYAHYRFGRDVLARLPDEPRAVIEAHRHLFDIGVHGPDILFYYKPLGKNPVNQKGYESHQRTGRDFFTQAIETVRSADNPEAARAYLYGVLCHFALDRECHPYVGKKEKDGVSHNAIEAAFDRYLMEKDGLDPLTHKTTGHLCPTPENAAVIAPFFPPVTREETESALKSMVFFLDLLVSSPLKRRAIILAAKAAGHPALGDLFITRTPNPACKDSDLRLYRLYEGAIPLAVTLIQEAGGCLDGQGALGPGFDHTFGET